MKRYSILFLCLAFLHASILGVAVSADDPITVRVGTYENSPKIFTDDEGNVSGFWPDIIEHIASEEGWEIEYVHGTWTQCLERLLSGEIDIMPDVAYTEERSRLYAFSDEPLLVSWSEVFAREGVDIQSIVDLEGKSIAVLQGSVNVEGPRGVKELVDAFDIRVTFIEVDSYTRVFELLDSGQADAGVTNWNWAGENAAAFKVVQTSILFQPISIHFAFPRESALTPQLSERIDHHLAAFKQEEGSIYFRTLEKWTGDEPYAVSVIPEWVKWALIGAGGLALLLGGGGLFMKRQVNSRTRELVKEIDERKQAEEQVGQAAEEWRTTFDSIADLISIHDRDCRIVKANKALADAVGMRPEEIIGKHCYEIVHGTKEPPPNCPHLATLESKKPATLEIFEPHLGMHLEVITSPLFDDEGEVIASTHLVRNVSERKRADGLLRESEDKYSTMVEKARDGIIILQDEHIVYCNAAFVDICGYSSGEILGMPFLDMVRPESKETVHERYADRLAGKDVTGNHRIGLVRKDEERRDLDLAVELIDYQGAPAVMAVLRDVTERTKAEHDTAERTKELACLYGVSQLADRVGTTLDDILSGAIDVIPPGWQFPEVTCARLTSGDKEYRTANFMVTEWRQSSDIKFRGVKIGELEVCYLEERPKEQEGPFLKEERDLIDALARMIGEIGERLQAEQDLRSLNRELEKTVEERTHELSVATSEATAANRSKSEFLASMSHELRTPLNAVIGFSQVLEEQYFGKLNEKQAEYVTDIHQSGQHLLLLINDILDLSKIEAGKMELDLSNVKMGELIEGSLVMIKEKALAHGISLDTHCSEELEDLQLMADERKLKQVMFNLLSNAAKFTPDGGSIMVRCWKEGEMLNVSVEDTGIGLAPGDQERIFGEFYQVRSSLSDKTPGTGLGLPLTRNIVEMHDGKIWVESEGTDKGSRFTFSLPIQSEGGLHDH